MNVAVILTFITATLIPIVYFVWQFTDRSGKTTDRLVETAVKSALQAESNKNALVILELRTQQETEILEYRVNQIEGFLNKTSDFVPGCLPGDKKCLDRKRNNQD